MLRSLRRELDQLVTIKDRQSRGRGFESLLHRVLSQEGLEVQLDPGVAHPRQTDLLVHIGVTDLIIEAKCGNRPAGVEVVAQIRDRLRRTPPDFIGCICSMADFTAGTIAEVEGNRDREIVLFDRNEISRICDGHASFTDLVDRKRRSIRVHGKAWFWTEATERRDIEREHTIEKDGKDHPWVSFANADQEIIFSRELLGLHEAIGGHGVALRLQINSVENTGDLRSTLREVGSTVGLRKAGSFSIHQQRRGWYGIGSESFLAAVDQWELRYQQAGLTIFHHSEELAFHGVGERGSICLTSRQLVRENPRLHSTFVEIQMPGVPVQNAAVEALCRRTGNEGAYFDMLESMRTEVRLFDKTPLESSAVIVARAPDEEPVVTGVVVKNPFHQMTPPPPKSEPRYSAHQYISSPEYLICSLRDWHSASIPADFYYLTSIESSWMENIPVLHVTCTWNDVPRRPSTSSSAEFRRRSKEIMDNIAPQGAGRRSRAR